jgi:methylenetetrahydrofolate reductase (NADPH)
MTEPSLAEPLATANGSGPLEPGTLLADFSLEMTGRDTAHLEQASGAIPAGTRINVTFLAHEDLAARLMAVRSISRLGFIPVPHISARRLRSQAMLEEFLTALRAEGASESVLAVGGDPAEPEGPYADALAIMSTGLLQRYGTRHVSVSGYPEGHPAIAEPVLWSALEAKAAFLGQHQLDGTIITQFSFDADPVLAWIEEARARGIGLPIRVGVPGPAGVRRLLGYAARFGVAASAGIARKYGLSLTSLMGTAGPDRFLRALADGYDPGRHGPVKVHFYTFGGLAATSQWIAAFRDAA